MQRRGSGVSIRDLSASESLGEEWGYLYISPTGLALVYSRIPDLSTKKLTLG